jgi:adenylate cyclase, class 2
MNIEGKELEIKFYISNRSQLERLLDSLGKVTAPRVLEVNLRFDTPDRTLTPAGKMLRLRMDTRARVTYKGPGVSEGGANLRQELEFTVSDFDTARKLFEALGYQVYMMYEKFRTTYQVGALEVVLDELPTGNFVEIEGPDAASIRDLAQQVGLDWERRTMDSYTVLFERARQNLGLAFTDLSFANFDGISVSPESMGVQPADV